MNTARFEKLGRMMQMGQRRFQWRVGVCGWGLPVGVGWSIVMKLMHPEKFGALEMIAGTLLFGLGGYYMFGPLMWLYFKGIYETEKRRLDAEW